MLNQYLANISVLRDNLYNLHFNIVGEGSNSFHEKLGEYIIVANNLYDSISETIKRYGGYPLLNNKDIYTITSIKPLTNQSYMTKEAKNIVLADFNTINSITNQVGDYCIKNRDYATFSIVLEFSKFLNKQIWLLTMEKK